jgi:hypothetical protein
MTRSAVRFRVEAQVYDFGATSQLFWSISDRVVTYSSLSSCLERIFFGITGLV